MPSVYCSFKISKDILDKMNKFSRKLNISRSEFIRHAVLRYLMELEKLFSFEVRNDE